MDFNLVTSNMAQHIPPTVLGLLVVGNWHKMAATVLEHKNHICDL